MQTQIFHAVCGVPSYLPDASLFPILGFDGKKCEKLTSISFQESDSYVRLPSLENSPSGNITILLATRAREGVIFYQGYDQHAAVEVRLNLISKHFHHNHVKSMTTL